MPTPTTHFIGRDGAAPALIVRWCRGEWPDGLPPGLVFCVPTALALRRLRDALADAYGGHQGVTFLTPAALPTLFAPAQGECLATPAEMLRAWSEVFDWLREADPHGDVFAWLFPGRRDWLGRPAARYALARRLMDLRATLAERCLDFAGVAAHPKTAALDERERGRWAALDALEARCREVLAQAGLRDPADAQLAALRDPVPQPQEAAPHGDDWRLVVACVPDLMPALADLFAVAPRCDILVQADPEEAGRFTALGVPDPEAWARAPIALPDRALRPAENPSGEAAAIERFLGERERVSPADLCLGVLDREIFAPLTQMLATHDVTVFRPAPIALADQPPARAVEALLALAQDGRFESVLPLLAVPELSGGRYVALRAAYDRLVEERQPETLRRAVAVAGEGMLGRFLRRCEGWVAAFRANPVRGIRDFLADLYGGQTIDPMRDPVRFATFEALRELLDELDGLRVGRGAPEAALFQARLRDVALRPARSSADCSYEGRLEILWSGAPLLVLAGLNEGVFPDTTFEDAFLPNAFRHDLGVRDDATRAARDAYILATAVAWRDPADVCLTCARSNHRGDWMRPSRLLFRCEPATCAARARRLFVEESPPQTMPRPESGVAFAENPAVWSARPPLPESLSPSAIKTFLASPAEFWLGFVLGLGDTGDLPEGIAPNLFGTLLHEAMEILPDLRGEDPEALADGLVAVFRGAFESRYGREPSVELLAMRQSGEQRLRAAARLEARSRAEGWRTRKTEGTWEAPLVLGDGRVVTLKGRCDRVDLNDRTGAWRVLDYKTGRVTNADSAHYAKKRGESEAVWADFQLPIYRHLARQVLGLPADVSPEVAYFTLPEEGPAQIFPFHDPVGESDTMEALRRTVEALLALWEGPIPATGEGFLDQLVKPTLNPTPRCD